MPITIQSGISPDEEGNPKEPLVHNTKSAEVPERQKLPVNARKKNYQSCRSAKSNHWHVCYGAAALAAVMSDDSRLESRDTSLADGPLRQDEFLRPLVSVSPVRINTRTRTGPLCRM